MISQQQQDIILKKLSPFHPKRVSVFGSYARGSADEGSDLDLMVVEQELTDTAGELQRLTPAAVDLRYDEGVPLLTREEADQLATRTLAWAEATVAGIANPAS